MLTFALAATTADLTAQQPAADLSVTRLSPPTVATPPGSNVTATYRVRNASRTSAAIVASLNAPRGWTLVLGAAPFSIEGAASDVMLLSVSIPARASAGRYAIAVKFEINRSGGQLVGSDSVIVDVQEHRAVDLKLVSRPSYVIAGSGYSLSLALTNRGNSRAEFRLSASASSGSPARYERGVITLEAASSKLVAVDVDTRKGGDRAIEDILEVHAIHAADTAVHADVATTVTIVQPAGSEIPRKLVPARVTLRGSPKSSGVSPYEIAGGGRLREGSAENVEFLFRGSPGPMSSFGDRDEYRMELSSTHYSIRAGDQLYSLSQLLSGGQMGFGGGLDLTRRNFGAGAYTTRFRYQPGGLSETGGYAGGHFGSATVNSQFAVNVVSRPSGPFSGTLIGSTARINPGSTAHLDFEWARSLSANRNGSAMSGRLVGFAPFHYDVGHIGGDAAFAGPAKGSAQSYATVSGNPFGDVRLTASANGANRRSGQDTTSASEKTFNTNFAAAWGGITLEHVTNARTELSRDAKRSFNEQGFILRTSANARALSVWSAIERGTGRDSSGGVKAYGEYSAGGTVSTRKLRLSVYSDYYNGKSINRGPVPVLNFGGDASATLPFGMTLVVNAFHTAARDSAAAPTFLFDSKLVKMLPGGASLGFRIRHTTRFSTMGPAANVGYLEYSRPLGLPLARSLSDGRAVGRIVDRATGRGIANTLVRVGPQAALTDKVGNVYFNGLPTGEYRAAIAQDAATASTVVVGNPNVKIDSTDRRRVRNFNLAVDLPGTIRARIEQMTLAKTGVGNAPDSLADGGPVEGVTVAFVNAQDTLYRVSDEKGEVSAADLPPGSWTVAVADDAPPMQRYEPATQLVTLGRGAVTTVSFSLIPSRRRIKLIDEDKIPLTPPPRKR